MITILLYNVKFFRSKADGVTKSTAYFGAMDVDGARKSAPARKKLEVVSNAENFSDVVNVVCPIKKLKLLGPKLYNFFPRLLRVEFIPVAARPRPDRILALAADQDAVAAGTATVFR